jgi:hypothetical protein
MKIQRNRYEWISSKFLNNDDIKILNVDLDQQKNHRAHFLVSNVVL